MLLKHLWPQLEKVVTLDWRMSTTCLEADIVLPVRAGRHGFLASGGPAPVSPLSPRWHMPGQWAAPSSAAASGGG